MNRQIHNSIVNSKKPFNSVPVELGGSLNTVLGLFVLGDKDGNYTRKRRLY